METIPGEMEAWRRSGDDRSRDKEEQTGIDGHQTNRERHDTRHHKTPRLADAQQTYFDLHSPEDCRQNKNKSKNTFHVNGNCFCAVP